MEGELCRMCGGDGRVGNALGRSTATCPSCHGSGRRRDTSSLFRDVTKTKPSHYQPTNKAAVVAKPQFPSTFEGVRLANEVKASGLSDDAKNRLVREITEYEGAKGSCTKTFQQKIRKQFRPKS